MTFSETVKKNVHRISSIVKTHFGAYRFDRTKELVDHLFADELEAAPTNPLKKCATTLGMGFRLYNGHKSLNSLNGHVRDDTSVMELKFLLRWTRLN